MNAPEKQPSGNQTAPAEGFPWQFRFVIIVIAAGLLMLIGKALGLF